MADPLSIAAALLAILTTALQATTSLHDAIKQYKDRDKILGRLRDEVNDLHDVLASLSALPEGANVVAADQAMLKLLQGPVERCTQLCHGFELAMAKFSSKSKTGVRDWARMMFMKGDMNEFIDTIAGYKSTISVGLGVITLHHTKVHHAILVQYGEMVKDTMYNLELRLQRMEYKIAEQSPEDLYSSYGANLDLKDEVAVTKQCLQLCQDGRSYMESLLTQGTTSWEEDQQPLGNEHAFEAQRRTREVLSESREKLAQTVSCLTNRLGNLLSSTHPTSGDDREQLQSDIDIAKQCLEICNMADNESKQKSYRVDEVIADQDSDQVVVNSFADLFNVGKALSKNNSAQLIGSMTPDNLDRLTEFRYTSRFGTASTTSYSPTTSSQAPESLSIKPTRGNASSKPDAKQIKPTSNEVRKRTDSL